MPMWYNSYLSINFSSFTFPKRSGKIYCSSSIFLIIVKQLLTNSQNLKFDTNWNARLNRNKKSYAKSKADVAEEELLNTVGRSGALDPK